MCTRSSTCIDEKTNKISIVFYATLSLNSLFKCLFYLFIFLSKRKNTVNVIYAMEVWNKKKGSMKNEYYSTRCRLQRQNL